MSAKQPKCKKRKLFHCKNITDELVITDEWDNIHYNINAELVSFQDRKIFEACSDRSIAHTFLGHAEKLLVGGADVLPDIHLLIEDLRTEIKNYDGWRIFVQTLRLVTTTYRMGTIPENIQISVTERINQSLKGKKKKTVHGLTPSERLIRNKKIIEHFKKSHLTANHFADKYAAKYGIKPRTIRDLLSKAVGI